MATITYRYSARDRVGHAVSGRLEGDSTEAVLAKLRALGYVVLELREDRLAQFNKIQIGSGVKIKDVTVFARQFATMINAGLSLTRCLLVLGQQTSSKELQRIIGQLSRDVEAGQSLSEAMLKHPRVFPPLFYNMVKAGETGGVLDQVLLRVAEHMESESKLRGRIKSAMTYPVVMGFLVLLVLVAMMVFVVPTFATMFGEMGAPLPLPTRILVAVSSGVAGPPGLIAVALLILGFFGFRAWIGTDGGRMAWDGFKLRIPLVGKLIRKSALARFTRTLGTLVTAGVPILSALDIVADTAGSAVVARAVRRARVAIKEGETIAKPLSESPVFPAMVVQMISVGEETGALDAMLTKIAEFYEEEVSAGVESLTSIIEPVMMATLGGMVGGIVIALYLPMFQMITLYSNV